MSMPLLCAALLALVALSGCSAVSGRVPATIVDAHVLPADPDDEPKPIPCLPVPPALRPGPVMIPAPPPRRPRPHPVRRPPPPPKVETPAPAPVPVAAAPVLSIKDIPVGQIRGMLDAQVERANGNVLGRAVDAVAAANGSPQSVVVNLMGFMGVGDRKVSLPWSALKFNPASKGKPPFTLTSDTIAPTASASAAGGSPPAPAGAMNLIDAPVRTTSGREVGHVVDVLLDIDSRPTAVVLNISDSLIHDKHLIAADWRSMHMRGAANALHLETDLDEKQIQASPEFEAGKPVHVVGPPAAAPAAPTATAASAPVPAAAAPSSAPSSASSAAPGASTPSATKAATGKASPEKAGGSRAASSSTSASAARIHPASARSTGKQ